MQEAKARHVSIVVNRSLSSTAKRQNLLATQSAKENLEACSLQFIVKLAVAQHKSLCTITVTHTRPTILCISLALFIMQTEPRMACLPKIWISWSVPMERYTGIITPLIQLSLLQTTCGFQATAYSMVHTTLLQGGPYKYLLTTNV